MAQCHLASFYSMTKGGPELMLTHFNHHTTVALYTKLETMGVAVAVDPVPG